MIYKIVFSVGCVLLGVFAWAQGENVGTATVFSPTLSCSLTTTTCSGPSYSLGASASPQTPSFGTMDNDVWFSFTAPSSVVKVRVCPTGFDAAVEVRSADGSTVISAFNNSASGIKEVSCVTGLTYNTVYTVRVGRVSGTGAGTFQMNIEHHASSVANNFYPGPAAGVSCYLAGNSIQRTLPCPGVTYAQTRFFFDGQGVPNIGPCTVTGGQAALGSCSSSWVSGGEYIVTVEVQANDSECGLIWWGYSVPRTIDFCGVCDLGWTSSSITPNNTTLSNICTNFSVAPFLGNYQFRWRFQTDNGNTEFCSTWNTGDLVTCSSSIFDCLRYNKSYQVSFGARFQPTDPICWYGPTTIVTPPMPYTNVTSTECCKWRNANSGFISGTNVPGYDQYRFRFTPIDPCNNNPPLQPIGPAITTGWSAGSVIAANSLVTPGTIYLVQEQGRILNNNCANCNGVNFNVFGQQTDWGSICIIGMRNSSSPAVGTPIGCFCTPGMIAPFEEDLSYELEYVTAQRTAVVSVANSESKLISVDLAASKLMGEGTMFLHNLNGQCVYQQKIIPTDEQIEFTIEPNGQWQTGIYVLTIRTTSGVVNEKLFLNF
jgi:hypothetical protein